MALTKASMTASSPDPERSAGNPDPLAAATLMKLQVPKQATSAGPRRGSR